MVIKSKKTKNLYSWFFFFRLGRLPILIFFPAFLVGLILMRSFYVEMATDEIKSKLRKDVSILELFIKSSSFEDKTFCNTIPLEKYESIYLKNLSGSIICHRKSTENTDLWQPFITEEIKISDQYILKKEIFSSALDEKQELLNIFLMKRLLPLGVIVFFIYLISFYFSTKPLGIILSRLQTFKSHIPLEKNLKQFYRKDEWIQIEEAITKADQKLHGHIQEIQKENDKNNAILESISDEIIAIDRFETVLFFNSKFKNNFILDKQGLEIEKKIWHIFEDDILKAFQIVLSTGSSNSLNELTFSQSQNPNRIYNLTITPLKSISGTINGALGVFHDITEFKLAEKMRVDFVANISHEIRTPLTSIRGYSQLLKTQFEKMDSEIAPFLEKIINNTERMISLFNDLLNLSVIESRELDKFESIDIEHLLHNIEDNIRASYPDKEIDFEYVIEASNLMADQRLIEQAILNLVDNSCKYSEKKVRISFRTKIDKNRFKLILEDDGFGISQDHLTRIFERFYRIENSRENIRGTGLGLSIVKQIIHKHHGKIWAECHGTGSIFYIELPIPANSLMTKSSLP